jgi:prevent-host-death family protein
MKNFWQLQEAQEHFNTVVEEALHRGPQVIVHEGEESLILLSFHEYQKLIASKTDLVDFFRNSPLCSVPLDLKRDKDPSRVVEL